MSARFNGNDISRSASCKQIYLLIGFTFRQAHCVPLVNPKPVSASYRRMRRSRSLEGSDAGRAGQVGRTTAASRFFLRATTRNATQRNEVASGRCRRAMATEVVALVGGGEDVRLLAAVCRAVSTCTRAGSARAPAVESSMTGRVVDAYH
jgi:hypothetical protein